MHGRKMHDQITEEMKDSTGIFLTKTAHDPEGPAWVQRKDRLQMGRILSRDMELLGAEAGDSNHSDIAVAPRLSRDPLDQIVAVPLPVAAAVGFSHAARGPDDVHIAARDEELGVAGLQKPSPKRGPSRLRRQ